MPTRTALARATRFSSLSALDITRIGLNGSSSGPQAGQTINNNRVALSTTYTAAGVNRTIGAIDLEANGFFSEIPPEVVDESGNPGDDHRGGSGAAAGEWLGHGEKLAVGGEPVGHSGVMSWRWHSQPLQRPRHEMRSGHSSIP